MSEKIAFHSKPPPKRIIKSSFWFPLCGCLLNICCYFFSPLLRLNKQLTCLKMKRRLAMSRPFSFAYQNTNLYENLLFAARSRTDHRHIFVGHKLYNNDRMAIDLKRRIRNRVGYLIYGCYNPSENPSNQIRIISIWSERYTHAHHFIVDQCGQSLNLEWSSGV